MGNVEHKYEIGIEVARWKNEEFGIEELQDAYAEALTKTGGLNDLLCHVMNLHESKLEIELARLIFDVNHRQDVPMVEAVAYKYDLNLDVALFLVAGLFVGWSMQGNVKVINKAGMEISL